jgi:hypothetical protein
MEHICVHVAIEGASEAWAPISTELQAATDIQLVPGQLEDQRVDVVFYDVCDPVATRLLATPDSKRPFWTIGVDLTKRCVVELSGSQFALTSVDDLAVVIRASGFMLRPPGEMVRFETGD